MIRISLLASAVVVAALTLTACKIVKTAPASSEAAVAGARGDAFRIADLVAETYVVRLMPHMASVATDITPLRAAISADLDAAGAAHGLRAAGGGGPWNFAASGSGTVIPSDRKARAALLNLDTDGDGQPDVAIQLGPVVKGTALRDVAPFYVFTDFRDQIEFAKLGRALNDTAAAAIVLPEGDLLGRTVRFTGAFAIRSRTDAIQIVPTLLSVAP